MEDLHSRWQHRWVNKKAACRQSKIHGLGTFAVEDITLGEPVVVIGGVIVPAQDIDDYRKKIGGHVGAQISEDFFICPTSINELKRTGVFNHSCNPNIGFVDPITCVAIRKIKKGEEIATDYAFMETSFEPFECECGSKNCRKRVTPDDWRRRDLQAKYGKWFSPYLKGRFPAR